MKRSRIFIALIFAGIMSIGGQVSAVAPSTQQNVAQLAPENDKQVMQKASEELGINYQELEEMYDRGEVEILPSIVGGYELRVVDADGNPVISVVVSEL